MGCAPSIDALQHSNARLASYDAPHTDDLERLAAILRTSRSVHQSATTPEEAVHTQLLQLDLHGVQLSSADALLVGRALSKLPHLQHLDMRDCALNLDGMRALSAGMGAASLGALTTLLVGGNWPDEFFERASACVEALSAGLVLGGATGLTTLSIPNGIGPAGARALCESLVALAPPLCCLDVSDSRFGCGGAKALRDTHRLAPLSFLHTLDLFACHIGPRGGVAIAEMLTVGSAAPATPPAPLSLTVGSAPAPAPAAEVAMVVAADAAAPPASDDAACAPAPLPPPPLLPTPPPLCSLCLADNVIEDLGLAALARALRSNAALCASLTHLDLSSNGLGLGGERRPTTHTQPCGS
jgi:hypothetical protein